MEKAILFEPKLLASVKQNSPDLYEFYCNTPFGEYDFVDYGIAGVHMYINREVLDQLEPLKKNERYNIDGIIMAFQFGYFFGRKDLVVKYAGENTDILKCANILSAVMNIIISYPYYTMESLLKAENFDYRDNVAYSKLTYQEAQHYAAWETIFHRHEELNSLFVRVNKYLKTEDPNNRATWGFPAFN